MCQFYPFYAEYGSNGATLLAKLSIPVANYVIELRSLDGVFVRSFSGNTSNGVVEVHWDLRDANDNTYTNDSVKCTFHFTSSDLGTRSNTQTISRFMPSQ